VADLLHTDSVLAAIKNQPVLGRLRIPLAKGEVALVHQVRWVCWLPSGTQEASTVTLMGALSHNFKLADIETSLTQNRMGTDSMFWAHHSLLKELSTNIGYAWINMVDIQTFPEPGFMIGGDQGVAVFQDVNPSPVPFRVDLYYTKRNVGEVRALNVSRQTSFSRVTT